MRQFILTIKDDEVENMKQFVANAYEKPECSAEMAIYILMLYHDFQLVSVKEIG